VFEEGVFPRNMEDSKTYNIVKPGKETCEDMLKYRPKSLLNTAAKALENVLISRIMYRVYSKNLMKKNQYGFTPRRSTVEAVMALKKQCAEQQWRRCSNEFRCKRSVRYCLVAWVLGTLEAVKMFGKFLQTMRELI